MLEIMTDLSAADWIVNDQHNNWDDWDVLATAGPSGYENYGRLRYIPDPMHKQTNIQDEIQNLDPAVHPSDYEQVRIAVETLAPFTNSPHEAYMLMWTGSGLHWADELKSAPEVDKIAMGTGRNYYLFRLSLKDIVDHDGSDIWQRWLENEWGFTTPPWGFNKPPAFFWPADQAWCLTSDVDPHWAGIGGSQVAIDALIADSRIDVVPMNPDEWQPSWEWPNRANRLVSVKRAVDGSRRIGSR